MLDLQSMEELFQAPTAGWRGFVEAWAGFSEWRLLLRVCGSLATAIALAAALAFHPRTVRGPTVAEIEAPKTLILYAVIGTIVAQVVVVMPAMAFVVFGIGGLLRFRTDIGAPGDTGLVILVTIVGIACGLNLFPLAVLGAAVGWLLLYVMENARHAVLVLSGIDPALLQESLGSHHAALAGAGVAVLASRARADRGRLLLTLRIDPSLSPEDVEARLQAIRPELRGAVEWRDE